MKELIYMALIMFWQLIFWDVAWDFALGRMNVKSDKFNLYTRWGIYAVTALVIGIYFAMAG